MAELKNYWDYLVQGNSLYQMGPQSHRVYLLNLLREKEVFTLFDVGCGTGPIYELINNDKEKWPFIYKGTDYSEGMIDSCKFNFPQGDFEVQDMRNLKEKDKSWDCVLFMHSLDHTDYYEKALSEAKRVSKKYILIVLWRGINYKEGALNNLNNRSRYGKADNDPDWQDTHLQDFAWEPLKKSFDDLGLKVELKKDDEEINKEKRFNTLILLTI